MNPNDPNVVMMELVAERLGNALRDEFVFIGGAVTGLLITDPGQPAIRPTEDVDLIVHAAVRADYQRVEDGLRQRGFVNDLSKDAPIFRWLVGGVTVDVMPTLEEILGFTNRWYPMALATATSAQRMCPANTHRAPVPGTARCAAGRFSPGGGSTAGGLRPAASGRAAAPGFGLRGAWAAAPAHP